MLKNISSGNNTFTQSHLDKYLEEKGLNRNTLQEFTVPKGITKIGNNVFEQCTSLTSIKLPDGITEIGNEAFRYCTSLVTIEIPEEITKIGNNVFEQCTSLTSIKLPDGITEIGQNAFRYCHHLQYIFTNQNFDWSHLGIETSRTEILTCTQYLEQKHPSLLDNIDMHNLEPHEAYLIYRMLNDRDYLPAWYTLKDTFQNRTTMQLHDLLLNLSKNINAINNIIPIIEIIIDDIPLHQSIFTFENTVLLVFVKCRENSFFALAL